MIDLALLGLLSEQNLHGYELKKQLTELLSATLSFGSLYPALARLERTGLVSAVEATEPRPTVIEPSMPMTGALSGELAAFRNRLVPRAKGPGRGRRGKKVYGITEAGRERFIELLTAPGPDDDRTFALRVAFCHHLRPAERLALFDRRKAELTSQLAVRRRRPERHRADQRPGPKNQHQPDLYLRSLRDRDARALTHDLAWLDELIEATRAEPKAGTQP
jgi:DNA-binding PadR family transcriptional regulator